MFDAHLTRPSLLKYIFGSDKTDKAAVDTYLQRADRLRAIIISHSHHDHVMDAPYISNKTGATIYGSSSALNVARGGDVPDGRMKQFKENEIYAVGGYKIRVTQEEIQALYRKHVYGNEGGSTVVTANVTAPQATSKPVGVMQRVPVAGLHSWRDIIEPHPDVAQGRYKNAEFAADLAQVARGEGAYEYRDPVEFFSRTYVTEGMKGLLTQALRRVGGLDGEPVIQLKTAFGGGKTHSMLALYHLLRGRTALGKLPHIKALVDESGIGNLPICRVAVLVGTALEPAKSKRPVNLPGITVNILWGELAYQLAVDSGNPKLYDIIKESDKKGVSPGSLTLKQLFDECGPCVVLIDELVAYAKKLWKKDDLPAGTFDNLIKSRRHGLLQLF